MTSIPTLETQHLILRAPCADDFEALAEFMASDRAKGAGGPANRSDAWKGLAMVIGHWNLRGYGLWHADEKSTGKLVGRFGFWNPEGWLGRELGWMVFEGFEGKNYAYEASAFLLDYAYNTLKWDSLISTIAPDNTRSITLAKRLGAQYQQDWVSPSGKASVIYRHPAPEVVQ
ncbi:MAG: GNAT family N-acetyltransferase [Paracoccaceae bacterium]